jgi:hypothetical protein
MYQPAIAQTKLLTRRQQPTISFRHAYNSPSSTASLEKPASASGLGLTDGVVAGTEKD